MLHLEDEKLANASARTRGTALASKLLWAAFAAILLFGLAPTPFGNTTAFRIFDGLFIFATLLMILRGGHNRVGLTISFICIVYLILDAVIFFTGGLQDPINFSIPKLSDLIYADKFIVYFVMMSFFIGKRVFSKAFFKNLLLLMLSVFCVKYTYIKLISISERPRVFVENNYELVWLSIVFLLYSFFEIRDGRKVPMLLFAALVFVFSLSGSRSGTLCLIPIAVFLYARVNLAGLVGMMMGVPAAIYVVLDVFATRTISIDRVDRFRFFTSFLEEVKLFDWWNYIVGVKPISPLHNFTCIKLNYYSELFSSQGGGLCYSPILHSFFLRSIIDHGILGVIVPFYFIFLMLRVAKFDYREAFSLIAIVFICSLAVSGIGTSFVAFPLSLALGAKIGSTPNRFGQGSLMRKKSRVFAQSRPR